MLPSLIHIIFASAASPDLGREGLEALVRCAHANNLRLGITGTLLFADGCFLQVLEGQAAVVAEMYARIKTDRRHSRVTQIICEPIPRRSFEGWSVGLTDASEEVIARIPGVQVNDLLAPQQSRDCLHAGRAMKLVAAFRSGCWRQRTLNMAATSQL